MSVFVKNDKMLRTLRVCGLLTGVWPLQDGAGKLQVISCTVLSWIYVVNSFINIYVFIWSALYYQNDNLMLEPMFYIINMSEDVVGIFYCMTWKKPLRVSVLPDFFM